MRPLRSVGIPALTLAQSPNSCQGRQREPGFTRQGGKPASAGGYRNGRPRASIARDDLEVADFGAVMEATGAHACMAAA